MKNRKLWSLASLLLMGSTLSHASTVLQPILAIDTVPEPSSVMLGAGLLLVGLGLVRKRQQK